MNRRFAGDGAGDVNGAGDGDGDGDGVGDDAEVGVGAGGGGGGYFLRKFFKFAYAASNGFSFN